MCLGDIYREGRKPGVSDPFGGFSFFCWSNMALDFVRNKGFSSVSWKSWIFDSSGFSGSFRNLVNSTFRLVFGISHTNRTLFFSLLWIQGSIEAKRINVSCSCIETKAPWLAPLRPALGWLGGGGGSSGHRSLWVPGNEVKGQCLRAYSPPLPAGRGHVV